MKNLDIENYNPKEIGRDRELHTISNFTNLSVAELLDKLYYSDTNYISYVDCYNHIKKNTQKNTGDFDGFLMASLNLDIVNFIKEVIDLSAYSIWSTSANDIMNEIANLVFEDVIDYSTGLANLMEYVSAFNSIVKFEGINLDDGSKRLESIPTIRPKRYPEEIEPFETYLTPEHRYKKNRLIKLIKPRLNQLADIDIARIYYIVAEHIDNKFKSNKIVFTSFCKELNIDVVESKPINPKGKYIVRKTLNNVKGDATLYNHPKLEKDIRKLFS